MGVERTAWRLRLKHGRRMASNPLPYIAPTRGECVWYAETHGGGLDLYILEEIPDPMPADMRADIEAAKPHRRNVK